MSPAGDLSAIFVRQRAADGCAWSGAGDELEVALAAHVAAAHQAWPEVALDTASFVEHLARRLAPDADGDALRALRATDLYLARAAADGDTRAIAAFERTYFGEVDGAAARMRAGDDAATEVKQILRRILFVREGARAPAIAEFAGRGDLRGWVRVSAVRELQRLLAKGNRVLQLSDETFLEILSPMQDPELDYLRDRYRRELADATAAAIAACSARERAILRYHVLDGLNIEEIGKLYGVHRSTVARWIASARERILARTRAELFDRFGIAEHEVDSIIRMVQSRLDVSMERVLA